VAVVCGTASDIHRSRFRLVKSMICTAAEIFEASVERFWVMDTIMCWLHCTAIIECRVSGSACWCADLLLASHQTQWAMHVLCGCFSTPLRVPAIGSKYAIAVSECLRHQGACAAADSHLLQVFTPLPLPSACCHVVCCWVMPLPSGTGQFIGHYTQIAL
jgi:hypothetical protein